MYTYKLVRDSGGSVVLRVEDGAFIPNKPLNRDWRKYQDWVAQGGNPHPADPVIPSPDNSDVDNHDKTVRTVIRCIAQLTNTPEPQAKAVFKQVWDSLP